MYGTKTWRVAEVYYEVNSNLQKPRRRRNLISESNDSGGVNTNSPGFINDDFEDNVAAFIRYTRTNNRSADTIKYYEQKLGNFMRTLEEQDVSTRLQRITYDTIVDHYIDYVTEVRGNKYTSVATVLRAIRAFFNWAVTRGVIDVSPMTGIVISDPKTGAVETFSREQLRDLFRQPDLETFVGFRDYVMMIVLIETGIRLREISDVKLSDVRFNDGQIVINGKNGESRLVPFQAKAGRVIKRYLKVRGASDCDYLFITQDDGKMSRRGIQGRLEKYGRMADIKSVRCSPHTFRHTFAKMSVLNGADVFALQNILGHKTLDMVRVYVNLFSTEVADAHRKFSPIENLF